jgi:hypothetical protein
VIISQYNIYVKEAVLDALSTPILHFAIQSLFFVLLRETPNFRRYFTATKQIVMGLRFGKRKVKEHLKLHLLRIYHIVIQLQLQYLIGDKVLSLRK